jgi:hypothetical protein
MADVHRLKPRLHPCRGRAFHRGRPVDADALNARWRGLDELERRGRRWPFLIVPGYCPHFGWSAGLHPKAIARLEQAARGLEAGLASTVIVSGGAVHSPDNEALLMREWLLERGLDEGRILVEPCARHTTTNLRNAGRMVLAAGATEALVVSSDRPDWRPSRAGWRFTEQSYYLGFPWLSSFHLRCLVELGYRVGELEWLEPMHVRFRPSPQVFRASWKETRAGDP